ncbi:hypothetical protein GCM10023183_23510 [Nibribacter koreensis]|uniref:Uncharacterized protein n=1 Tax=Nibribacter koreensis TaxID=1084519 RepID=A0ABP8FMY5_9BACT
MQRLRELALALQPQGLALGPGQPEQQVLQVLLELELLVSLPLAPGPGLLERPGLALGLELQAPQVLKPLALPEPVQLE